MRRRYVLTPPQLIPPLPVVVPSVLSDIIHPRRIILLRNGLKVAEIGDPGVPYVVGGKELVDSSVRVVVVSDTQHLYQ